MRPRLALPLALLALLSAPAAAGDGEALRLLEVDAVAPSLRSDQRVALGLAAAREAESPLLAVRAAIFVAGWTEVGGHDPAPARALLEGVIARQAELLEAGERLGEPDGARSSLAALTVAMARFVWWTTHDAAAVLRALEGVEPPPHGLLSELHYRLGRTASTDGLGALHLEEALRHAEASLEEVEGKVLPTLGHPVGASETSARLALDLAQRALRRESRAELPHVLDAIQRLHFAHALALAVRGDDGGAIAHLLHLRARLGPAGERLLAERIRLEPDLAHLLSRPAFATLLGALERAAEPVGPPRVVLDLGATQLVVELPPGFERRRVGVTPVAVGPGRRPPWIVYGDISLAGLDERETLARLRRIFPDGSVRRVRRGDLHYLVVELPLEGTGAFARRAYLRPGEGHVLFFVLGAADGRALDELDRSWAERLAAARQEPRGARPPEELPELEDAELRDVVDRLPNLGQVLTDALAVSAPGLPGPGPVERPAAPPPSPRPSTVFVPAAPAGAVDPGTGALDDEAGGRALLAVGVVAAALVAVVLLAARRR